MADWKEYDGSDEQLRELNIGLGSSSKGVLLRLSTGKEIIITAGLYAYKFTHYLICEPHPRADMICQQARTGQEVWVRRPAHRFEWDRVWGNLVVDYIKTEQTTTPDWNIPNAEYSFTPFED